MPIPSGGAQSPLRDRFYPEAQAGGFSRQDGTVEFYARINSLLHPAATVVDLGAGRGAFLDDTVEYRRQLRMLRGKVARVIGLDVDPVVLENPTVDEAHVLRPNDRFPLPDATVDLVVSDFTFEHVSSPEQTSRELERILRPGGWICARTPNKWGYIGTATRAVPNRLHDAVLSRLQPAKPSRDTFPTRYLLNTRNDLRRHFPPTRFLDCTYAADSEPAYFNDSIVGWRVARLLSGVTPAPCRSVLYVFLQKL